jgi:hypothetical protein
MAEQFVPYSIPEKSHNEIIADSQEFHKWLDGRRSVRYFSDRPVPKEVLENISKAVSKASSGTKNNLGPSVWCLLLRKNVRFEKGLKRKNKKIMTVE